MPGKTTTFLQLAGRYSQALFSSLYLPICTSWKGTGNPMPKKLLQPLPFSLYLSFVNLIVLYPIFLMFKISTSHPADIMKPHKDLLWGPAGLTLEHWHNVFTSGLLLPSLFKSLLVATMVMLLAILIAAPAAYVIARLGSPLKYLCIIALFLSRTFPEVAIALPVSVVFLHWNLLDTSFGLILAHLIKVLPYVGWILIGTFEAIPLSLEEASSVDGASKIRTLRKVIFPLSLPCWSGWNRGTSLRMPCI